MGTHKTPVAIFLALAFFLGTLFVPAAEAASSITPPVLLKLVSTLIQPIISSYTVGTQIQSPALVAASSSVAAGSLTRGPLVVKIAALTLTGTSTPSNEIATSSQGTNSEIQFSWAQVPGATGYAIYIGTSTPGSEQSYFLATSTSGQVNNFYTLQSTSSPTYYAIPGQGAGYYTNLNSASTSIDTTGFIRAYQQATTSACSATLNGVMFYNTANSHLWLCTGAGPTYTKVI